MAPFLLFTFAMKNRNLFLILAQLILVLTPLIGCKRSSSPRPSTISTVDATSKSIQTGSENRLAQVGLTYDQGHNAYTGSDKMQEPCHPALLKSISQSLEESNHLHEVWRSNNEDYRNEALDFYRRIEDSNLSLTDISRTLNEFCEGENAPSDNTKVLACFEKDAKPIQVTINTLIASYLKIHPFIQPESNSKVSMFLLEGETAIRLRTYPEGEAQGRSTVDEIGNHTDLNHLKTLSECLKQKQLKSEIGSRIASTASSAFTQALSYCHELKARMADKPFNMKPAQSHLCGAEGP